MLKIKNHIYFLVLALFCSSVVEALETPELKITSQCVDVKASWNNIQGASGYELWYQPIDRSQDSNYIDLSAATNDFSVSLWNGADFFVGIMAYNDQELSKFSPTELLRTGDFLLHPNQKISINNLKATLSWNQIDNAEGYELWYSFNSSDTWEQVEFDKNTHSISVDLWEGAYVQTAIASIDSNGYNSRFSDIVNIVTGDEPVIVSNYENTLYPTETIDVFPASISSQYSSVLQSCAYSKTRTQSCNLNTLPLLGQEFMEPDIDNIMDRTLVSHKWMAERFKQFLQRLPAESLKLFRAVTAIVISGDVRPAHYSPATGAIYLDPYELLIKTDTDDIIDTVDKTEDYRSKCGDSLNYKRLFRYVKSGDYAYNIKVSERTMNDVLYLQGRVLFHELSHANDVFPPTSLNNLPGNISVHKAADININNRVSYQLEQRFALSSEILKYQADVMYDCTSATCQQTSYTANEMAMEFIGDTANDTYSYSNVVEDLAMLSEEVMMHFFFGLERDVAITNFPTIEEPTGDDYIVEWGQRRRIAEPNITRKVKFILNILVPEIDFSNYLDNLAEPVNMTVGNSWNDNLNIDKKSRLAKSNSPIRQDPETYLNYR